MGRVRRADRNEVVDGEVILRREWRGGDRACDRPVPVESVFGGSKTVVTEAALRLRHLGTSLNASVFAIAPPTCEPALETVCATASLVAAKENNETYTVGWLSEGEPGIV